jgi:hypothetical protein
LAFPAALDKFWVTIQVLPKRPEGFGIPEIDNP